MIRNRYERLLIFMNPCFNYGSENKVSFIFKPFIICRYNNKSFIRFPIFFLHANYEDHNLLLKYFELLFSIFSSASKVFSLLENIAYLQLLLKPEVAWRISTFRNKWACLVRHKFVCRCHQVLLGYNRRHHLRNRTHIYWQLFRLSRIIVLEKNNVSGFP